MKKTFKRPDGTEVTVEGTPDELAQYEQKINEGTPTPKKKPVLKGSGSYEEIAQWVKDHFEDEFAKLLKELEALRRDQAFRTIFIERDPAPKPHVIPWWNPITPTCPNPWDMQPQIWCSDNIQLTDGTSGKS